MMTLAKPQTTMPMPIWASANPWYCASSAPDKRTRPFASASPKNAVALDVNAQRANHLRIVAGSAHGGAQCGAEEPIQRQAGQQE